MKITPVGADI